MHIAEAASSCNLGPHINIQRKVETKRNKWIREVSIGGAWSWFEVCLVFMLLWSNYVLQMFSLTVTADRRNIAIKTYYAMSTICRQDYNGTNVMITLSCVYHCVCVFAGGERLLWNSNGIICPSQVYIYTHTRVPHMLCSPTCVPVQLSRISFTV